tara:strand:+ start:2902 stop:3045 length:144 start_codon:yes stop_codon:yes gene_type:complete
MSNNVSLSTEYILEMARQMSEIQMTSFKAGIEFQKQVQAQKDKEEEK